ncbi:hypothetical protein ACVW1A_002861 [Bradyrhizobium sp. LB1.3]
MPATYQPQQFSETFKTSLGQQIWAFLNEGENLIRMETASYLSRPALEALSPILKRRFGDAVFEDRIKRMTGHMVRQILEAHGYRLDRTGVRITTEGNGYSTAARYTLPASGHVRPQPDASLDHEPVGPA